MEKNKKETKHNIEQFCKQFRDGCKNIVNVLDKTLSKPVSLNEIIDSLSKTTDELILEKEKAENIKFIAGTFNLVIIDNNKALATSDLYFKDGNNDWVKDHLKKTLPKEIFIENEFEKIKDGIKLSIVHPND